MNRGLQRIALAVLAMGLLWGHRGVYAEPYGGTSYGACQYSSDCPAASTTPSPSTSSGSSGGATGESTRTTDTASVVILNDYREFTSSEGKQSVMAPDQVVYFDVLNTQTKKTERHSVTVKEIGSNYVVLVIASSPVEVRLTTGEKRQVDVTDDANYDIEIKLVSIEGGKATLVFRSLTATTINTPVGETPGTQKTNRDMSWYLYGACAALGIAGLLVLAVRRRARNV